MKEVYISYADVYVYAIIFNLGPIDNLWMLHPRTDAPFLHMIEETDDNKGNFEMLYLFISEPDFHFIIIL